MKIIKLNSPGKINITYVSGKDYGHTFAARANKVNYIRILDKRVSYLFHQAHRINNDS